MRLIAMLLVTVSVLTLLSGLAVFCGASKGDRSRSAWFFLATIFATVWMASITIFLVATPDMAEFMALPVDWTYISSVFIDIALLGYISWRYKTGKIATVFFTIAGIILACFIIYNPSQLYTDIIITNAGNSLATNFGPFYFVYIAFFCTLVPAVIFALLHRIIKSSSQRIRSSDLILLVGFAISGTMSLVFNLILPLWTWNYIWVGPLAIGITILAFYYSVLRYHALNLSSRWLKVLSYIIIITTSAVVYMVIFSVIFAALFKGSTPSTEVIVLNFIMIVIVLLLTPAVNEISMLIHALMSNQKIDMLYIIKKLSRISPQGTNIQEIAAFLAEHMHFDYIGITIDGKVYGSDSRTIPEDSIKLVESLGDPERGVWQEFDETTEVWQKLDLSAVAALRTASGKTFGQVMVGKPRGKNNFTRRDLVQVETIINLAAVIIDSGKIGKSKKG